MINLPPELAYAIAAGVGFLIGILITWLMMRGGKAKQREYDNLVREFEEYRTQTEKGRVENELFRAQVDRHFADTADAVDELNRSYKNVVQHLSSGAQILMGREALQEQLAKRSDKSVTLAYLAASGTAAETETQEASAAGTVSDDNTVPPLNADNAAEEHVAQAFAKSEEEGQIHQVHAEEKETPKA